MRVFAFNLSSVAASESIVGAQLKIHGLRNSVIRQNSSFPQSSWIISMAVYEVKRQKESNEMNVSDKDKGAVNDHFYQGFKRSKKYENQRCQI